MLHRTLLPIVLLASLSLPSPARAEDEPASAATEKMPSTAQEAPTEGTLIAYLDDDGQLHVVNSLEAVPQKYRSRARPAELGEVSTISPQGVRQRKAPRNRSSSKPKSQAPGGEDVTKGKRRKGKTNTDQTSVKEKLAKLRERRNEVLDELGLLNEGWLSPEDNAQAGAGKSLPNRDQLEDRSAKLSKQLDALDRKITELEAKK